MKNYFTTNLTDTVRAKFFLDNRFAGCATKDDIRACVYDTYYGNEGVRTLEGSYLPDGVNADLRRACCYAFADYLYETAKAQIENDYYKVFSSHTSMLAPGVKQEIKMAVTRTISRSFTILQRLTLRAATLAFTQTIMITTAPSGKWRACRIR